MVQPGDVVDPGMGDVIQPVYGIENDDTLAILDSMPMDTEELGGGLDDIDVTIIGFSSRSGGEIKQNQQGEDFETRDTLMMHLRVDDIDGVDATTEFFSLPKLISPRDGGEPRRGKVSETSRYGIWLASLENLGVSRDPNKAWNLQVRSLADLIGLRYHRQSRPFEVTINQRTSKFNVNVPTILHGFDNELRAELKLPAATLKSVQQPSASRRSGASGTSRASGRTTPTPTTPVAPAAIESNHHDEAATDVVLGELDQRGLVLLDGQTHNAFTRLAIKDEAIGNDDAFLEGIQTREWLDRMVEIGAASVDTKGVYTVSDDLRPDLPF